MRQLDFRSNCGFSNLLRGDSGLKTWRRGLGGFPTWTMERAVMGISLRAVKKF